MLDRIEIVQYFVFASPFLLLIVVGCIKLWKRRNDKFKTRAKNRTVGLGE